MLEHPAVMSLRALHYRSTFSYETECSSCNITFESDVHELIEELESLCLSILKVQEDDENLYHFFVNDPDEIFMIEMIWRNLIKDFISEDLTKVAFPP